jgi:esterase
MELYFKEFRPKSPVVILHGLFGFSDNWQTIAKALSEDQTVLTPDLRNHGRSPHVSSHSYLEMADDLKEFLEQRRISQAVVIGHSMGGKAAMQLAMNYPDLVEKLVIIDMEPGQAADNHREIFKALFDLDFSIIKTRQEANDFLSSRLEDEGTRQFLLKNITRETNGEFAWKMNLSVLWKDYHNILAPVSGNPYEKPALFIRGGKSNYIKDEEITLIEKYFPNSSVVTIEGAGHWVHADKPAELLAVVKGFLG